jgi:hypothetical protein
MTAPEWTPLLNKQLDLNLVVWGAAIPFDGDIYAVVAEKKRSAAVQAVADTNEFEPEPIAQLVFHHPDRGWVFASNNEDCRTL